MAFEPEMLIHKYDARPIVQYDIIPKIEPLLRRGYIIRNDGKVGPSLRAKSHEPPWIYVRSHPDLNCTLWNEVMFSTFKIFPEDCLDCWKVVVRPRTVKELITLHEIEDELTTRFCKCGIEVRHWVPALYGGYFYNRSKNEGLDCLKEVRDLVYTHISPDVPVFLKRYCTEFELTFGPSEEVEDTLMRGYFIHPDMGKVNVMSAGEMQVWRNAVRKIFDIEPDTLPCDCQTSGCRECNGLGYKAVPQPPFVKQHVIRTWFDWAWSHGDMTVKEFFGGEDLYTPSKRYEDDREIQRTVRTDTGV